jgi:hypothetical protein
VHYEAEEEAEVIFGFAVALPRIFPARLFCDISYISLLLNPSQKL